MTLNAKNARGHMPSQEVLRDLLTYNPETGELFWAHRPRKYFSSTRAYNVWNSRYAGTRAFAGVNSRGYHSGSIFNKVYRAHRVIFELVHGASPAEIDHIDGDLLNNRIENLREASRTSNMRNRRRCARNSSGVVGVTWHKQCRKWVAYIGVGGGRTIHLGLFDSLSLAAKARRGAEHKLGYDPNHGRVQG